MEFIFTTLKNAAASGCVLVNNIKHLVLTEIDVNWADSTLCLVKKTGESSWIISFHADSCKIKEVFQRHSISQTQLLLLAFVQECGEASFV
jgi:hypothetical protein